jgi:hypothetical protein
MRPHRSPCAVVWETVTSMADWQCVHPMEKLAFAPRGRHISQRKEAGDTISPVAVVRRESVIGFGVCQFILLVRAGPAGRLLPLGLCYC